MGSCMKRWATFAKANARVVLAERSKPNPRLNLNQSGCTGRGRLTRPLFFDSTADFFKSRDVDLVCAHSIADHENPFERVVGHKNRI